MSALAATPRLIRLALRRDRIVLPVWIASISGLAWAVVANYRGAHPTEADRIATATFSAGNPLTRVFDGPASGTHIGAMAFVEGWKILAILTFVMAAQAVVRHTRLDEETGRAELVGSAAVGRYARLTAALVVALAAAAVAGLSVAACLVGATGLAASGALATGMATAGIGWVGAGVAAVTAQVFSTARTAMAVANAVLGLAFAVRAAGDLAGTVTDGGVVLSSTWVSWLSPYGWGQQVRPFSEDNWWVAVLFVGLTALLVAVSAALAARRDVGPGMVPLRPGPARASATLRTSIGLAWRLQRGVLLAWTLGLAAFGAAFGSLGDEVGHYLDDNDTIRTTLESLAPGAEVIDVYYVFTMALIGLAAGGYVVQALLRMRAEEVSGRVEPLLAAAVGRRRWLGGHVLVAGLGSALVVLAGGGGAALSAGAASGDWTAGPDLLLAAAVQIPAVLVMGGLVVGLVAVVPRWAGPVTWFALGTALVMGQLGKLLDLPTWLLKISPFTHVPLVPAEPLGWGPVLGLLAVAVALLVVGLTAFHRRDLRIPV